MKVAFRTLLGRLTGISTPVFGISWEPRPADREVAERVLTFLEDKRVLLSYATLLNYFGQPIHIVRSVDQIRAFLTTQLLALSRESDLFSRLDAMRKHCRYLQDVFEVAGATQESWLEKRGHNTHTYWPAVMEFKVRMGLQIAALAVAYGVDVPEGLARELPSDPEAGPTSGDMPFR